MERTWILEQPCCRCPDSRAQGRVQQHSPARVRAYATPSMWRLRSCPAPARKDKLRAALQQALMLPYACCRWPLRAHQQTDTCTCRAPTGTRTREGRRRGALARSDQADGH